MHPTNESINISLPFLCSDELYDEVSALLNETYQKLISPPEEIPSVSILHLS